MFVSVPQHDIPAMNFVHDVNPYIRTSSLKNEGGGEILIDDS